MRAPPRPEAVAAIPRSPGRRAASAPDAAPAGSAGPPPSECPTFASRRRAWGSLPAHRRRLVPACQQFFFDARPVRHEVGLAVLRPSSHRRPARPCWPTTRCSAAIMFSRLRIISISRPSASGRVGIGLAVALDAPSILLSRLPAATLGSGAGHLSPAFCVSSRHRKSSLLPALHVQPFIGRSRRLLWPRLTSAAPSRRLAASVAHPPKQGQNGRPPRVRRVTFTAIYLSHLRRHPPDDIGLRVSWPPRPDAVASYALPVRQAGALPTASFRPRLATTPLLFG